MYNRTTESHSIFKRAIVYNFSWSRNHSIQNGAYAFYPNQNHMMLPFWCKYFDEHCATLANFKAKILNWLVQRRTATASTWIFIEWDYSANNIRIHGNLARAGRMLGRPLELRTLANGANKERRLDSRALQLILAKMSRFDDLSLEMAKISRFQLFTGPKWRMCAFSVEFLQIVHSSAH